jgi:hypothetical protein
MQYLSLFLSRENRKCLILTRYDRKNCAQTARIESLMRSPINKDKTQIVRTLQLSLRFHGSSSCSLLSKEFFFKFCLLKGIL